MIVDENGEGAIGVESIKDDGYASVRVEIVGGGRWVSLDRDGACRLLRELADAIDETWGGGPERR